MLVSDDGKINDLNDLLTIAYPSCEVGETLQGASSWCLKGSF